MTSGVKQALPLLSIPKAGVEGKAVPGRKGGPDFMEALGKLVENDRSADTKHARTTSQENDLRSGWPRFANRLDASEDQATQSASPLARSAGSTTAETEDTSAGDDAAKTEQDDTTSVRGSVLQAEVHSPDEMSAPGEKRQAAPAVRADSDASATAETAAPTTAATVLASANRPPEKPASTGRTPAIAASGSNESKQADETGADDPATVRDSAKSPSFVPMGRGQQAEPIRFEPVTRPVADSTQPSSGKDKAETEALPGKDAAPAPRITVVSQQNIPAPTASTAVVLIETIAASDLLEPAVAKFSFDPIHVSVSSASAQSLKIQLHPAELGMVTATLRFAGEQLSIELKVENQEAYRRLSSDSDIIVNSLRDLGYDIDRVTVLQPSAPAPGAKADASLPMTPSQGRSAEQFGQGANGEHAGSGGRPSGEDRSARHGGQQGPTLAQRESAGGVYI
ncbi:flagellar hook-length control protein FliK [Mesorhizobium sp. VNQ89]|uniref:flagellar hook-length control protein FliK n=1 Tax=Mesorhizobium quangtriensis TaxID=3157709 RepID=UPI0032B6FEF6